MLAALTELKEAYVAEKNVSEKIITEKQNALTLKESQIDATLKTLAEKLNVSPPQESAVVVGMRKKLNETEANLTNIQRESKEKVEQAKEKYVNLHRGIMEAIPPSHVWKAWTFGPKLMVSQLYHELGVAAEDRR
jgi:molecular chaperone GrpE (heat shock protein)